jgi:hypothetical protein
MFDLPFDAGNIAKALQAKSLFFSEQLFLFD